MAANVGANTLAAVAAVVADALHEPPQRAWQIAVRARLNAARWSREANRCLVRLARGIDPDLRSSAAEARHLRAFADYLQTEPAPKLVLGMHAGNFLVDVVKALVAAPVGTCAHVPVPARSMEALQGVARFAAAQGKQVRFRPIKTGDTVHLRRLERGNDVCFVLLDLGADYGKTTPLPLFDAPAHLVIGPYVLARRLAASVTWIDSTPGLAFAGPFDDCTFPAPPRAADLGHRFAARMEATILRDPAAWTRWHTLPALRRREVGHTC